MSEDHPALPGDYDGTPWQTKANCKNEDPELFFPDEETMTQEVFDAHVRSAKAICALCTVRRECLNWSIEMFIPYGVWGGRVWRSKYLTLRARDLIREAKASEEAQEEAALLADADAWLAMQPALIEEPEDRPPDV